MARVFLYTNHEKNYMQLSELSLLGIGALICVNPANIAIYLPTLLITVAAVQYKAYKDMME